MPKNNRHGQSEILSPESYKKIKDCLGCPRDRVIAAICYYTGERIGAVLQLDVKFVYSKQGKVMDTITFPARTRKGKRDTRQLPIHPTLKEILQAYEAPKEGWLFPSPRNREEHIDRTTFDKSLRKALERAGMSADGISTHSFRRTLITNLANEGCGVRLIQSITGHRSLAVLQRYIEVKEADIKQAISLLPV